MRLESGLVAGMKNPPVKAGLSAMNCGFLRFPGRGFSRPDNSGLSF